MDTLVRVAKRRKVYGTPNLLYMPGANPYMKLGQFAWNNRAAIYKTAVRFANMAGKRRAARARARAAKKRKFSPRNFGERPGTDTAKKIDIVNADNTLRNTRTLIQQDLSLIPFTGSNVISGRQREMCNLRGIKICMSVLNVLSHPLLFNVAVIAPKDSNDGVSTTEFFRGFGADRSQDFDVALSAAEFHCLPINTDKYTVLWHYRRQLNPVAGTATYSTQSGKSYTFINKYVKIKRQIRFDYSTGVAENGRIFLVFWADRFAGAKTSAALVSAYSTQEHHVTYFRESKA